MSPLLIPLTVIALAAIMIFAIWWMNRVADFAIGSRHRSIEEILDTRRPPAKWLGKREDTRPAIVKLDKLIEYVKTTRFIDSEDSRNELIVELSEIRTEWAGM